MTEENQVYIRKLIVHILDSSIGVPVLSDCEHPLDDDVGEFIEKHLFKILKDEGLKDAWFTGEGSKIKDLCGSIIDNHDNFSTVTKEIGEILYGIMEKNPDIPPADVACSLFDLNGDLHMGIMKLNYRPSYIHYVGNGSSGKINSIIKQKTTLPGEGQRIDECALINLRNFSIKLLEKKYEINGEKLFYFSTLFIGCSCDLSGRDKIKIFKKATEKFNKKYCGEDITKSKDLRKAISESIEEEEAIDVVKVAENVFKRNPGMRDAYIEHIEKAGLRDKTINVSQELTEKVFRRHKIKTDTGIEINLPVDYYKDNEKVEFINNTDGTISIVIKNISSITDC